MSGWYDERTGLVSGPIPKDVPNDPARRALPDPAGVALLTQVLRASARQRELMLPDPVGVVLPARFAGLTHLAGLPVVFVDTETFGVIIPVDGAFIPVEHEPNAVDVCEHCDEDEPCMPCARCEHVECQHESGGRQYGDCLVGDCTCHLWLSDSDCTYCDGSGSFSVDVEIGGGHVREDDRPCPWCRGSGVAE